MKILHPTPAADLVLGAFIIVAAGNSLFWPKDMPQTGGLIHPWDPLYYALIIVGTIVVAVGDVRDWREWRFFGSFILATSLLILAASIFAHTGVHFNLWIFAGLGARYATRCFVILHESRQIRQDRHG